MTPCCVFARTHFSSLRNAHVRNIVSSKEVSRNHVNGHFQVQVKSYENQPDATSVVVYNVLDSMLRVKDPKKSG